MVINEDKGRTTTPRAKTKSTLSKSPSSQCRMPVAKEKCSLEKGAGEGQIISNDHNQPSKHSPRKRKVKKLKTEADCWEGVGRFEGTPFLRIKKRKRPKTFFLDVSEPTDGPKLSLKRNTKPLLQSNDTAKRVKGNLGTEDSLNLPQCEDEVEESSVDSPDVILTNKLQSKLPVPEKIKIDDLREKVSDTTDMLSKVVGLETLYAVLSEEHLGLQMSVQEAWRVVSSERAKRKSLETEIETLKKSQKDNPINVALAQQIEQLQASEEELKQRNHELTEELELMEFRILEMDASSKRTVGKGSDKYDAQDVDDVSDSGVMSLPTSEDELQDFTMEYEKDGDVKSRLMEMCKLSECVADRISLQQALALLRHYEARIEALESTIAAMCHEATMARSLPNLRSDSSDFSSLESKSSGGRIIATVLPFTDTERKNGEERKPKERSRDSSDCLQESGIFEESLEVVTRATQTDFPPKGPEASGDLSQEIRKLTQIRERIEEQSGSKKLVLPCQVGAGDYTPSVKEVLFYRERLEALESRLSIYESSGDTQLKQLSARLERETLLSAQVRHLKERVEKLEDKNARLEEERCELEEAENDTRLRCQKLELKLSALGEKKAQLKAQLQEASRTMSNLKSSLEDEERKKTDARKHASRMETLVQSYEQKNAELEERELEVRYRLQILENTMPALMMWNMWRMMYTMQGGTPPPGAPNQPRPEGNQPTITAASRGAAEREEELMNKMKAMENKLAAESRLLQESRQAEAALRDKVEDLEKMLNRKEDDIIEMLDRDPEKDVEMFDKLSKMAKDRMEMDRRIKDLEMKERLYQETLEQADTMFAEMEGGFAQKIQEKDKELEERDSKIFQYERRNRQESTDTSMSTHLQEKIDALESEVSRLQKKLSKREAEKGQLEEEEKKIMKELQEALAQIEGIRRNIEGPLRSELEAEKRKSKERESKVVMLESKLEEEDARKSAELAVAELREALVKEKEEKETVKVKLESELEKKNKLIEEMKIRPSTPIEKSIKDEIEEDDLDLPPPPSAPLPYTAQVSWQRLSRKPLLSNCEDCQSEPVISSPNRVSPNQSLSHSLVDARPPQVSLSEMSIEEVVSEPMERPSYMLGPPHVTVKKLMPQLRQMNIKQDRTGFSPIIEAFFEEVHAANSEEEDQAPVQPKTGAISVPGLYVNEFRRSIESKKNTQTKTDISKPGLFVNEFFLDRQPSEEESKEKVTEVNDPTESTKEDSVASLQESPKDSQSPDLQGREECYDGLNELKELIAQTTKQLQVAIDRIKDPDFNFCSPTEENENEIAELMKLTDCKLAQKALAGSDGKDVKGTIEDLTKAFIHSKNCKLCGDQLGDFLQDLIQQLGVKLPRVKKRDESEYAGQPSDQLTDKIGPGTIAWDPKCNEAGYKLKPTVSSLQLTIQELSEKLKLKDHLIEKLADELKLLKQCGTWSDLELLEALSEFPDPKVDFERRTLISYLNNEPVNSLETENNAEVGGLLDQIGSHWEFLGRPAT